MTADRPRALRILLTNHSLCERSGSELYVRDLALQLQHDGHEPAVYTTRPGVVSDELAAAGVRVCAGGELATFDFQPDVIHGQHRMEAMAAILRHPRTPAIFICHNHTHFLESTVLHPAIRRYFGVSQLCIDRLVREGVPRARVGFLPNFVDVKRFAPRAPLPARPARALVFSNYAGADTQLPAITEACRQAGLPLDVIGARAGTQVARPEEILGRYDLVFAKAKAAMEAMAVGAAVVLCDFGGAGPMVTSADFSGLQKMNFGFQSLSKPLGPGSLLPEIARYDAEDARKVRDLLRATATLEESARTLAGIYRDVIAEHADIYGQAFPWTTTPGRQALTARDRVARALLDRWLSMSPGRKKALLRLPGSAIVRRGASRLFRVSNWESV